MKAKIKHNIDEYRQIGYEIEEYHNPNWTNVKNPSSVYELHIPTYIFSEESFEIEEFISLGDVILYTMTETSYNVPGWAIEILEGE